MYFSLTLTGVQGNNGVLVCVINSSPFWCYTLGFPVSCYTVSLIFSYFMAAQWYGWWHFFFKLKRSPVQISLLILRFPFTVKNMHVNLIGYSKLTVGMNVSLHGGVSLLPRCPKEFMDLWTLFLDFFLGFVPLLLII